MGGSETALYQTARHLAKRGHNVRVVSDISNFPEDYYDSVYYTKEPVDKCDALIYFRGSHSLERPISANRKIWWSTDAYLEGDNWQSGVFTKVDSGVTISNFHTSDLQLRYGNLPPLVVIPLGCDPSEKRVVEKIPNRLIYCSEAARGLPILLSNWQRIKAAIPDASLDITFDYRLWNRDENTSQYRWLANQPGINYHGLVDRRELLQLQAQAQIHIYPCTFPENFCLAALECQLQSTPNITTAIGALPSTVGSGGYTLNSYDDIINKTITYLRNPQSLVVLQNSAKQHALTLTWDKSAEAWENFILS